jgi:hypothetical protein
LFRFLLPGLAASVASVVSVTPAQAGILAGTAQNCQSQTLYRTFLPYTDLAQYQLAPDGQFAAGGAGWSMSGGAQVVAGGDGVSLNGAAPSTSALSLPAGSSATSPTVCVGIGNPDLRFFATNTADPTSVLNVSVNWIGPAGLPMTTQIGAVTADGTWQPMPVDPIIVNLLPLLPGNQTPVTFTFAPSDNEGSWQIDDVWVDPVGRCC